MNRNTILKNFNSPPLIIFAMKPPNGKAIDKNVMRYNNILPNKGLLLTLNTNWFCLYSI